MSATKERPILFSAPMVRAILAGEKTQTRRVMQRVRDENSPAMESALREGARAIVGPEGYGGLVQSVGGGLFTIPLPRCPYGGVEDRLWVRETWQHADWTEDGMPWIRYAADGAVRFIDGSAIPEAWGERLTDRWADLSDPANVAIDGKAADRKWRPSIFMPPWASRITLEITDVRVQRLQDISDDDCIAEGVVVSSIETGEASPCELYRGVWETINGSGSWDANPWVWVVTFRKVTP